MKILIKDFYTIDWSTIKVGYWVQGVGYISSEFARQALITIGTVMQKKYKNKE